MARLACELPIEPFPKVAKELFNRRLVVAQAGRKLDQQGAERGTKVANLVEEALQRRPRIDEPAGVRDLARHLGREAEARRHGGGPALVCGRMVRTVEGRLISTAGRRRA